MELILIRHGKPDYSHINKNDNTKLPIKAHLSEIGVAEAMNIFKENLELFEGANLILVSPFTRALDTAFILNEYLNLPLNIEEDLHEWLPDRFFEYTIKDISSFYKDYKLKNGIRQENEPWENDEEVIKRVKNCLKKYKEYDKIIIVAHSRLFKINFNLKECDYCSIHKIQINSDFF